MKTTQAVISRMVARHRLLLVSALLSLSPLFAASQNGNRTNAPTAIPATPFSAAAAQARRDQLAKIPELIGDPDPNARLANLETILNTHDSIMIQTALRLAFRSDDVNLRALAMRAYIETLKEVTFDIIPPAEWMQQYEAVKFDQRGREELFRTYEALKSLDRLDFKLHLTFKRYSRFESTGYIQFPGKDETTFTITGDRFSTKIEIPQLSNCYFEFTPSNDMTLRGKISCEYLFGAPNWHFPPSTISARLF